MRKHSFSTWLRPRVALDLPVNNAHGSILIPLANVTGAQPPIFREDILVIVEIIALVVSASNGGASKEDFALRWVVGREVSGLGYVEELDFCGWARETHGAVLHDIWWKDGAHAAGLCHTITYAMFNRSSPRHVTTRMIPYLG
jgi:hypothetical protein